MTPFISGALGALAVLFAVALIRRAMWRHARSVRAGRWPLRFLYRRLRTRPEQERAITAEADALAAEIRTLRADLRSIRDELADLLAAPTVEVTALQAAIDARVARLSALRARFAETLAHVHAALDPEQRATLAALVRQGGDRRRCAHGHA